MQVPHDLETQEHTGRVTSSVETFLEDVEVNSPESLAHKGVLSRNEKDYSVSTTSSSTATPAVNIKGPTQGIGEHTSDPIETIVSLAAPSESSFDVATNKSAFTSPVLMTGLQGIVATLCVLLWFSSSITLSVVNKTILDIHGFNLPLTVTSVQFLVAAIGLLGFSQIKALVHTPAFMSGARMVLQTKLTDLLLLAVRKLPSIPAVSWRYIYLRIMPIALFTCMDVILVNTSYSLVSLSVVTVMRSSVVACTYLLAVLNDIEKFRFTLAGILLWIIFTVAMSVSGLEVKSWWGILVLAGSAIASASRWILIHKELHRKNEEADASAIQVLLLIQVASAATLLPLAVLLELPMTLVSTNILSQVTVSPVHLMLLCLFSGVLVLTLLIVEFKVVEMTSSLTLTVVGIGKECLIICVSILKYSEQVGIKSLCYIASSALGILCYGMVRNTQGWI